MTQSVRMLFVTACLLVLIAIPRSGWARQVTIGVVQDGPSEETEILGLIEPELKHLVGTTADVVFKRVPAFDAGWEAGRFRFDRMGLSAIGSPCPTGILNSPPPRPRPTVLTLVRLDSNSNVKRNTKARSAPTRKTRP